MKCPRCEKEMRLWNNAIKGRTYECDTCYGPWTVQASKLMTISDLTDKIIEFETILKNMNKKIDEIYYSPGMPGYIKTKVDFTQLVEEFHSHNISK